MNNLLRVRFVFDNEQSSISLDPNSKIELIREIVQLSHKADLTRFDLLYKNKIIFNTSFTIREIIGKDQVPTFHFKHKGRVYISNERARSQTVSESRAI